MLMAAVSWQGARLCVMLPLAAGLMLPRMHLRRLGVRRPHGRRTVGCLGVCVGGHCLRRMLLQAREVHLFLARLHCHVMVVGRSIHVECWAAAHQA